VVDGENISFDASLVIYRVIQNDCRGFNNLSYTIHLRQQYIIAPMDQELLKVFFYGMRCAVCSSYAFLRLERSLLRWIGRGTDDDQMLLAWPPRSPYPTPCDFLLWGYLKDQVYTPISSVLCLTSCKNPDTHFE
jgi:hypothetical protein